VIVASKALSGIGLPVSILLYDRALDVWKPGAHIGTFRGNQLAFAGGIAALDVIERDDILENVRQRGEQVGKLLNALADCTPWIKEVRGLGLMWGIELTTSAAGVSAAVLAAAIQAEALNNGLIVEVGGREDAVIRILPPLNITEDLIACALSILAAAFTSVDESAEPAIPEGGRTL
jgi:diaminobutyrate-2-oxoglutarate transaminase